MVDGTVAHHLEVLGDVPGRRLGVVEGMGEAQALDRRLGDAPDAGRRLDPQQLQHRRDHVDGVGVLRADFALGLDALGPVDDERVADAAAIGLALPAAEGRVARPGPAPRVVVEVLRPAEVIEGLQVIFQGLGHRVEEQVLVDRAGRAALGAGAVVGDEHDERVLPLADLFQECEQAAVVIIRVGEESREHLHHAGVDLLLLR